MKRRNCLQKCFHPFIYKIGHKNVQPNICTALCDFSCTTCCIFPTQISQLSQVYGHTIFFFFFLNIRIFKNLPQTGVSHNVNISNLGNVLQRNLRKNRAAKEYILEHLEPQIFKILHQICYTNHKWHL